MSPSQHRARARESLRGNWPNAVLVGLVAALLGAVSYSGPRLNIDLDALQDPAAMLIPVDPRLAAMLGVTGTMALGGALLGIVVCLIIGGAIHVGYCRYHLNLIDGKEARLGDLFCFIDRFGTALLMQLLRSVIVFVGTLLFFIPGIIAGLGLSQAGYILSEDPGCSATDALRRSWEMMRGHKMDLFILELTFIGWVILAGMTFGIGSLFLTPYTSAAHASFYRNLSPLNRQQYTTYQSYTTYQDPPSDTTYL